MMDNFNKSYWKKHTKHDVILMIDLIYSQLFNIIKKEFNLTFVSVPIFTLNNGKTLLNFTKTTRPINFDLLDDYEIGTLFQSLSRWSQFKIVEYGFHEDEGIIFQENSIWRDIIPHSKLSHQKSYLCAEIIIKKNDNYSRILENITKKVYEVFYKIALELNVKYDIPLNSPKKIQFIEPQLLDNEFPNLPSWVKEAELAKEINAFILTNPSKPLLSGKIHAYRSPITYHVNHYNEIIMLNTIDNTALNIAAISLKLWGNNLKKVLNHKFQKGDIEFNNLKDIYNNDIHQTIEIRINLFKLYQVLLKKAHISEVQPNVISKSTKSLHTKGYIDPL